MSELEEKPPVIEQEKTDTIESPNKKIPTISRSLYIVSMVVVSMISVGGTLIASGVGAAQGFVGTSQGELAEVETAYQILKNQYVDSSITSQQLIDGAIKGMTQSLGDPYSDYLVNSETSQLDELTQGSFGGIGAEIGTDANNRVMINNTREGTPSREAGLQAGDVILKVDGTDVIGKTVNETVMMVRGEVGTDVTLTILRGSQEFDVTLTRAKISVTTVTAQLDATNSKVGHIQITSFARNTTGELQKAIEELRNQGATLFVFDLRHNPGGLLDQAIRMSNMFVKDGETIVQVEDRYGNKQAYKAGNEFGTFKVTEPYVVLVDEGSASASEIFAGALKESANATIIGTKTYGKGTVQTIEQLTPTSELKFTNAKWLTPNGNWIHQKGIEPTIEVVAPEYTNARTIDASTPMQEGTVSAQVKNAELVLQTLGYDVVVDGYYDAKTTTAVKNFQKAHSIEETGVIDVSTANELMKEIRTFIKDHDVQYQEAVKKVVS